MVFGFDPSLRLRRLGRREILGLPHTPHRSRLCAPVPRGLTVCQGGGLHPPLASSHGGLAVGGAVCCRDTVMVSWAGGRVSDSEASVLTTHPRCLLFRWLFRSCRENTCPILDAGLNCICVLEEDSREKAQDHGPQEPRVRRSGSPLLCNLRKVPPPLPAECSLLHPGSGAGPPHPTVVVRSELNCEWEGL